MDERLKLPRSADGYTLLETIGVGASATVWRAQTVQTHEDYAVKIIDLDRFSSSLDELRKEIQTMAECNHPNIVSYYQAFVNGTELWLVMPFYAGGSALDIMKYAFNTGLEENLIATLLREVLKGLEYLHKNGHIHRDIKAGNILVDSDGEVHLADFGVCATLVEEGIRVTKRQTFVGTPCWMAPEVMEQESGYDSSADIWSFGITALELARGHAPFAKFPPMKVLLLTLQNPPPTLDDDEGRYSKSFKEMLELCLQKNPTARPTASKLLEHKFFKQAKKGEYVVQHLLAGLPPLAERARVLKEQNDEAMKRSEQMQDKLGEAPNGKSWNFNVQSATVTPVAALPKQEPMPVSAPAPRTAVQSTSQETTPSSESTVDMVTPTEAPHDEGLKRKSRFKVIVPEHPEGDDEAHLTVPSTAQPTSSQPMSSVQTTTTIQPTPSTTSTQGTVTRKGRFMVLESAGTSNEHDDTPSQEQPPQDNNILNVEGLLLQLLERSQRQEKMLAVVCGQRKKADKDTPPEDLHALQAQLHCVAGKVTLLVERCETLQRENAILRGQLAKYTQSIPPTVVQPVDWNYDVSTVSPPAPPVN